MSSFSSPSVIELPCYTRSGDGQYWPRYPNGNKPFPGMFSDAVVDAELAAQLKTGISLRGSPSVSSAVSGVLSGGSANTVNFVQGVYAEVGGLSNYHGLSDFTTNLDLMIGLDVGHVLRGVFITFNFGECESTLNNYSTLFTEVNDLLTAAQSRGLLLGMNINISGNVGSVSVPGYMLNNATYGDVQSGTGYKGGLFNGASAGHSTGNAVTVRFDVPATAARIAALCTALYVEFGPDLYAINPTFSEIEDLSGYVPQMTQATIVNTFCNSGGMFDQLRGGCPKPYLMFSPSYLDQSVQAQMFAATDRNKIACGTYDFTNELPVRTGGAARVIPGQTGFRGGKIVNGAFQTYPGLIDRRANVAGGGRDFWAHIGPDELGQSGKNSDGSSKAGNPVPPARLGDGDLDEAIWPQIELMQCSHVILYNNRQTGPRCNATSPSGYTPAANYSNAFWANAMAYFAGKTMPANQYPRYWVGR